MDLAEDLGSQPDLFGATLGFEKWRRVYATIDALDLKHGKHTVFLASTFRALKTAAHLNERSHAPLRAKNLFNGENIRQHVGITMLGHVI
jgi:hypothetical protein